MPKAKTARFTADEVKTMRAEATATIEESRDATGPRMTDPEWTDWLMGQLTDREKDENGNPRVTGLRRLARLHLGTIVGSIPGHFIGAEEDNGFRATSSHIVSIAWGGNRDDIRVFGGIADTYSGNTDPEYCRHAAATAETKAEARAYRRALALENVVAAEELTNVPVTEAGVDGLIVPSQERGIDTLCKRLDINVSKFINSGSSGKHYKHVAHVPYKTAQVMIEQLNKYQQKMHLIPEPLKGYDETWKRGGTDES